MHSNVTIKNVSWATLYFLFGKHHVVEGKLRNQPENNYCPHVH